VVLNSDALLDSRLGPLDQIEVSLADRAEREAHLFAGDPELEHDVERIVDSYKNAMRDFQDALSDCSELRVAIGYTARDFVTLAYVGALVELARSRRPPTLRLSHTAAYWPSIAEQAPNAALRHESSWVPVEKPVLDDASRFWTACTEPTPDGINALANVEPEGESAVAATALVERFPSEATGLTVVDDRILRAVPNEGILIPALLDAIRTRHGDPDPGSTCGALLRLRHLSAGGSPLVRASGPISYLGYATTVALTPAGRAVLSGDANALDVLRHDYWIGGVHVDSAQSSPWVRTSVSRPMVVRQPQADALPRHHRT
jgi:hypothetical protein